MVPAGLVSTTSPSGSDVFVTSSTIPIVNLFLGLSAAKLSNTAIICEG